MPEHEKIARPATCRLQGRAPWSKQIAMIPLLDKFSRNLSTSSIVAAAEMAVGVGVGLLLAGRLGRKARQRVGVVTLAAGLAATVPLLIGAGVRVDRKLGQGRRTRQSLESIREDSGFPDDGDFY